MSERLASTLSSEQRSVSESARALLAVEDLSVHYLGQDRWVLQRPSLVHLSGQVTAVIGPSGCGKTTFVRAVCGLVPHCLPSEYSGSVQIAGAEIADATVQLIATNVAYVGQNPDAAVITRTVYDDVAFALQNLCLPVPEIDRRVREALAAVGLETKLWESPWRLSGGQRQRLAIAVALAMQPRLLVLDEPTSMIDTQGTDEFYSVIQQLVSDGVGIVVIDHDLDPVLPLCDHVIALNAQGAVIAQGTPHEVFLGHTAELEACGVWLPRALRDESPHHALTCEQAGIRVPRITEICGDSVQYQRRTEAGWETIDAIDTLDGGGSATVELADFCVPGRSPAISMRLRGGEFIALIGPNGAGKTSLLAALAGLIPSKAQRATVCGEVVRRGRHQVGYVFQNPEHQMVCSTVAGEISTGDVSASKAEAIVEQFHLSQYRDQHPLTLSGGQIRRLSVATMVAESRDVIVLDEPTYGQDWANTCELMAFIDELRAEGRTVIMATHDLELALSRCSHIIALPAAVSETRENAASAAPANPPSPSVPRGLFSSFNPVTLLLALIPAMVMVFVCKDPAVNVGVLIAASLAMVAARASRARTVMSLLAPWVIAAVLLPVFRYNYTIEEVSPLYNYGGELAAASGIGALLSLMLLSGISTHPEALLRTLTTTFKLPYRVTAAGTAAVAFVTRFRRDFQLLRTARALRGIGASWGPLAPAIRWVGSLVPLAILAVQHGERVALSMDSRGFSAYPRRTELQHTPWQVRDWCLVGLLWAVTALLWWWRQ